ASSNHRRASCGCTCAFAMVAPPISASSGSLLKERRIFIALSSLSRSPHGLRHTVRWDDEGALHGKVAARNSQPQEDRTRLRSPRRVEVGQALFHPPEKERGDRHPAEGRLRALLLQRRAAEGPKAHSPEDRRAYAGRPLDSIHLS